MDKLLLVLLLINSTVFADTTKIDYLHDVDRPEYNIPIQNISTKDVKRIYGQNKAEFHQKMNVCLNSLVKGQKHNSAGYDELGGVHFFGKDGILYYYTAGRVFKYEYEAGKDANYVLSYPSEMEEFYKSATTENVLSIRGNLKIGANFVDSKKYFKDVKKVYSLRPTEVSLTNRNFLSSLYSVFESKFDSFDFGKKSEEKYEGVFATKAYENCKEVASVSKYFKNNVTKFGSKVKSKGLLVTTEGAKRHPSSVAKDAEEAPLGGDDHGIDGGDSVNKNVIK